jgi:hypothetical protein
VVRNVASGYRPCVEFSHSLDISLGALSRPYPGLAARRVAGDVSIPDNLLILLIKFLFPGVLPSLLTATQICGWARAFPH